MSFSYSRLPWVEANDEALRLLQIDQELMRLR
jgi:hypothetical protein